MNAKIEEDKSLYNLRFYFEKNMRQYERSIKRKKGMYIDELVYNDWIFILGVSAFRNKNNS